MGFNSIAGMASSTHKALSSMHDLGLEKVKNNLYGIRWAATNYCIYLKAICYGALLFIAISYFGAFCHYI